MLLVGSLVMSGCKVKSSIPEKTTAGDAYDVVVIAADEVTLLHTG